MQRRNLLALVGAGAVAWPRVAPSDQVQPLPVRRIGFLVGNDPSWIAAFKDELREHGYTEGENLIVETRILGPNTPDLTTQATELAHLNLELIVAAALRPAEAIRQANPAMPMVIVTCPGMVSNAFAASVEHPGGNVTGMEELPPGLTAKRLTLLKTAAPSVARIALLSTTPGRGGHETQLADAEQAASGLSVTVRPYRATSVGELKAALAALVNDQMDALLSFQGALSLFNRKLIVDFAAEHRLPAMYQATLFAEAGGLMAWAPDLDEQFRIAARYVDKILKGERPADLPIQYPPRYYLTINAGAARAIELALPEQLLTRADRVIN
jgi:putative ABC transport system substrate-binding protein